MYGISEQWIKYTVGCFFGKLEANKVFGKRKDSLQLNDLLS